MLQGIILNDFLFTCEEILLKLLKIALLGLSRFIRYDSIFFIEYFNLPTKYVIRKHFKIDNLSKSVRFIDSIMPSFYNILKNVFVLLNYTILIFF